MKLVSPTHRGMACMCRWPATPAPAACPRFMPKLNPCGLVEPFQSPLGHLRQINQFVGGISVQLRDAVEVRVRHHHHVTRGVWVRIQANKAMFAPQDQTGASSASSAGIPCSIA